MASSSVYNNSKNMKNIVLKSNEQLQTGVLVLQKREKKKVPLAIDLVSIELLKTLGNRQHPRLLIYHIAKSWEIIHSVDITLAIQCPQRCKMQYSLFMHIACLSTWGWPIYYKEHLTATVALLLNRLALHSNSAFRHCVYAVLIAHSAPK